MNRTSPGDLTNVREAPVKGRLAIGALAIWLCTSVGVVHAQGVKSVAVMSFSGKGAAPVRNHVIKALTKRSEIELVPMRAVENAANRLGISLASADDYRKVAQELSISTYIEGEVTRSGGRWEAMVLVRDG